MTDLSKFAEAASSQSSDNLLADDSAVDFAPSIGTILRATREKQTNKSLDEISEIICVRAHLLKALEDDDFSRLPGVAYVTGFLRNYAQYLSLDAEELVSRYKGMIGKEKCTPELVFPEPMNDGRIPPGAVAAIILLFGVGAFGAWTFLGSEHDGIEGEQLVAAVNDTLNPEPLLQKTEPLPQKKDFSKPVLAGLPVTPEPEAVTAAPVPAAVAPAPAVEPYVGSVVLRASADSYVRIVDAADNVLIDRVLRAGEKFTAPKKEGMFLTTGNAGALDILVDGEKIQPVGGVGTVKQQVSLNAERLLAK